MKAAHYDLSVKIARKLWREIEEVDVDAVATECGTCMLQIEARQDTREDVHPVVLLCDAYQKAGHARGGP
jgi:glycerol-3-phosphate dehydrogenase subunit C